MPFKCGTYTLQKNGLDLFIFFLLTNIFIKQANPTLFLLIQAPAGSNSHWMPLLDILSQKHFRGRRVKHLIYVNYLVLLILISENYLCSGDREDDDGDLTH